LFNDEMLKATNLELRFGGFRVVDRVSFTIRAAKTYALIGPNGSGKTSLFNAITGVYKPQGGKIFFRGKDITSYAPHRVYREGIVRTFQYPKVFYKMTIIDNLIFAARNQVGDNPVSAVFQRGKVKEQERNLKKKALDVLDKIGLTKYAESYPSELSGGQLKLLELGRALMTDPKLLMLDEPAAGINPILATQLFKILRRIRDEENLTIFLIEHRLEIVREFVDWVYVMRSGKIVLEGSPNEVLYDKNFLEIYTGG